MMNYGNATKLLRAWKISSPPIFCRGSDKLQRELELMARRKLKFVISMQRYPEVQQGGIRERRIPATRVPRLRLRAGGVSLLSQDSLRLQIQYLGNLPLGSNNRCVRRTFRIFRHFDSEQTLAWAASELLVDCAGKVTFIVIHFAHNLNGTPQL